MIKILSILCVSVGVFLTGCVQMTPVPGYARSGDTLVLGLGGIQRNAAGNQVLVPDDLVITLTDSANVSYRLAAQQFFKTFPDYGSQLNFQTVGGTTRLAPQPLTPFDGGWFVSVQLAAGTSAIPNLATGPATISITSPTGKLVSNPSAGVYGTTVPTAINEGNLLRIPLEILPGTTPINSPTSISYGRQFRAFSTHGVTSFNIAPSTLAGLTEVGGMQVSLKYVASNYSNTIPPLVVPYSHNPAINLQQNVVDNGDGTNLLNIVLTAPKGFAAEQTALKPSLRDLNLKVIYFGTAAIYAAPDFQVVSSKLIDTSGNVIPGLTAVRAALAL
jgi:hypothetical protein